MNMQIFAILVEFLSDPTGTCWVFKDGHMFSESYLVKFIDLIFFGGRCSNRWTLSHFESFVQLRCFYLRSVCGGFKLQILCADGGWTHTESWWPTPEEHRNDAKSCCVRQVMLKVAPSRVISIGDHDSTYRVEMTPVTAPIYKAICWRYKSIHN